MKVKTEGRCLWARTVGSTIVGEAVDSLIFYPLAFLGVWSTELVLRVMLANYALKVGWETVMTPVTYRHRELPEAGGERGLLRPRDELHSLLAADLRDYLHFSKVKERGESPWTSKAPQKKGARVPGF